MFLHCSQPQWRTPCVRVGDFPRAHYSAASPRNPNVDGERRSCRHGEHGAPTLSTDNVHISQERRKEENEQIGMEKPGAPNRVDNTTARNLALNYMSDSKSNFEVKKSGQELPKNTWFLKMCSTMSRSTRQFGDCFYEFLHVGSRTPTS